MVALIWIFTILLVWLDLIRLALVLILGWPFLLFKGTRQYILNLLIACDQSVNALCGGDPDETISSRLGKDKHNSKMAAFWAAVVDFCFRWGGKNHTDNNEELDEGKNKVI